MPEQKLVMNAALPDTRPQDAKDKDYRSTELPGAAMIETFKHPKTTALGATLFDQWYVGSCVPHGFYTMLEYEGIVPAGFHQSQLRAYRKRINYPGAGSVGVDMLDKIRAGQSNDYATPAGATEALATAMPLIAGTKQIKDFKYFQHLDSNGDQNFTLVPYDVAQGKAVAIFIFATEEEWSREYVDILTPALKRADAYVNHCVCIIPNGDFTDENGIARLAVHDSANFGGRHLRHISYAFLLSRAYFSVKAYAVDALPPAPNPQPIMKPTTPCQFNDNSQYVRDLQGFLVGEKKLAPQYITGQYGPLTAKAVLWYQLENWQKFTGGVPTLLENNGHYWGKESIATL